MVGDTTVLMNFLLLGSQVTGRGSYNKKQRSLNKTATSLLKSTACVKEKHMIMDRHHQKVVSVPHECSDLVLNHSKIITAFAVSKKIISIVF